MLIVLGCLIGVGIVLTIPMLRDPLYRIVFKGNSAGATSDDIDSKCASQHDDDKVEKQPSPSFEVDLPKEKQAELEIRLKLAQESIIAIEQDRDEFKEQLLLAKEGLKEWQLNYEHLQTKYDNLIEKYEALQQLPMPEPTVKYITHDESKAMELLTDINAQYRQEFEPDKKLDRDRQFKATMYRVNDFLNGESELLGKNEPIKEVETPKPAPRPVI